MRMIVFASGGFGHGWIDMWVTNSLSIGFYVVYENSSKDEQKLLRGWFSLSEPVVAGIEVLTSTNEDLPKSRHVKWIFSSRQMNLLVFYFFLRVDYEHG